MELKIIKDASELKPGWVLCYDKDHRIAGPFCHHVVYTGGGHYDLIDGQNNGWMLDCLFGQGHKVYLVEEETYYLEPLCISSVDYFDMCQDSYHLITYGSGSKNANPWWVEWSDRRSDN